MEQSVSPENLGQTPQQETTRQGELDRKFVEVNGTRVSYIERGNPL